MRVALLYGFFGIMATILNLITQDLSLAVYPGPFPLLASVAFGTLAGLVTKYLLDRNYIFHHEATHMSQELHTFYIYTLVGIFTTAIYLCFEFGFHHAFQSKQMRYIGAALGLGIGYCLKYRLDKKYVFT